jgi:hypothetical protein
MTASARCRRWRFCRGQTPPYSPLLKCLLDGEAYATTSGPDVLLIVRVGGKQHARSDQHADAHESPTTPKKARANPGRNMGSYHVKLKSHKVPRVLEGSAPSLNPLQPASPEGVRLTEAERDSLTKHLTGDKIGGLTLYDRLDRLIASPGYLRQSEGPNGTKADMIRGVYGDYLEAAEIKVRRENEGELQNILMQRELARLQGKLPPRAGQPVASPNAGYLRTLQ